KFCSSPRVGDHCTRHVAKSEQSLWRILPEPRCPPAENPHLSPDYWYIPLPLMCRHAVLALPIVGFLHLAIRDARREYRPDRVGDVAIADTRSRLETAYW